MNSKLECPKCSSAVSTEPIKAWKYQSFDVKRYECKHCKSKFNLYQSPKATYTIPKRK